MIATVIPSYNEPRDQLLSTVASAAAVSDFVVVSDDGSAEPIAPLDGAVVVRHDNAGPAAAMNRGVAAALELGATRIARLDVGDRFTDARRRQAQIDAPAVASWHYDLVRRRVATPREDWRASIYMDGVFCVSACVVSAEVWREVGGFDESLRYADDWDWTMRVQYAAGWTVFDEVTCEVGGFPGGHSARGGAALRNCRDVVRRRGKVLRHEDRRRSRLGLPPGHAGRPAG